MGLLFKIVGWFVLFGVLSVVVFCEETWKAAYLPPTPSPQLTALTRSGQKLSSARWPPALPSCLPAHALPLPFSFLFSDNMSMPCYYRALKPRPLKIISQTFGAGKRRSQKFQSIYLFYTLILCTIT